MQELIELAEIVTAKKLKASKTLERWRVQYPQEWSLYKALTQDGLRTEVELLAKLFPDKTDISVLDPLKERLHQLLLEQLYQVELSLPSHNIRQKAYFECYKKWNAIKLLMGRNAWINVISLAEELLKKSTRFEFTEIAVDLLRTLRLYYGSIAGVLKKYEQYKAQAAYWEQALHHENQAEALYTDLVGRFVNTKAAQQEVHEKAKAYYELLRPALEQHYTYRLHLSGRLIESLIYTSINDYRNTIAVCERAIHFFEQKEYPAKIPLQIFLYQEMVCYVQLKDFERGQAAAERGLRLLDEGSFNWFKYQELLIFLSMHTRRYQRAYWIFRQATAHRRFHLLPQAVSEIWRIIEAYIFYLVEMGKINLHDDDKVFTRFRMARFVNEMPIFSRDKRGMNIPILIFQILILIQAKRYDTAIDRVEAIEKYCSRYLRRDDTFRSNCFIKMLLTIPAQGFHRVAVTRHAEKYRQMLLSVPMELASQSHDVEIIPYEDLWEMALESLENKVVSRRK